MYEQLKDLFNNRYRYLRVPIPPYEPIRDLLQKSLAKMWTNRMPYTVYIYMASIQFKKNKVDQVFNNSVLKTKKKCT